MKIGFIGLGRMGGNMVRKLLQGGHEVVVWNRSDETIQEFKAQTAKLKISTKKLKIAKSIQELVTSLEKPRVIWSMVLIGEPTDVVLAEVEKHVDKNDIVIDGGNAHFPDTQKRYEHFTKRGIRFLGLGVSGGIWGPKFGYPIMAGGDKSAYQHIKPALDTLVKPNSSHDYFGQGGAGHFVKMMHNAIEYAYMQAIGEGFDVLKNAPYKIDLLKVANLWATNSLVSGFMMDMTVEALKAGTADKIEGVIDRNFEADWAIEQAKKEGIDIEIIRRCVEYRIRSQKDKKIQKSYTAKMVAALRLAFGAHPVKKK